MSVLVTSVRDKKQKLLSDSWWDWMNQYNEGKNGDDGTNAIMEAATDLQEILEEKKPTSGGLFLWEGMFTC